jgi:hypothetical protein
MADEETLRRAAKGLLLLLALALVIVAHAAIVKDPSPRVDAELSASSTSSENRLSIDMDGDWTYVGYLRRRYLTGHDAYVNVSVNQGGTWRTGDQRLNTLWGPGQFAGDMERMLVATGGDDRVYGVMVRRDIIEKNAYAIASSDGGRSW